ncbi:MAG: BatD family protein [Pseudomonadales bacterium]|nr:BatD family protein [Pseudomonadales bacterium]
MKIYTLLFSPFIAASHLVLLCAISMSTYGATLFSFVDRDEVRIGDIIKLTIESGKKTSDIPNIKPLEVHFKIIQKPKLTNYTSTQNGHKTTKTRWIIKISPRHSGSLHIPSLIVNNQKTSPIAIKVIRTSFEDNRVRADKPVFIHSEVNKRDVYFQEQVILMVRVFHSTEIEGKIIDPLFETSIQEPLGEKREYRTNIEGVRYRVKEWKYAIFPQQTGELVIDPFKLEGSRISGQNGFFLNKNTIRINESSLPISIDVKEIPAHFPKDRWLPAEQVVIEESWSLEPPQFKVGEPITRTIKLQVLKQLSTHLPSQSTIVSKFFKIYPDQAQSENKTDKARGILTTRAESIAIVPTKPGEFRLPEIKTYWWNTTTNKMEISSIPERTIVVAPSPEYAKLSDLDTPSPNHLSTSENRFSEGISPLWKVLSGIFLTLWLSTTGLLIFLWKKLSTQSKHNKVAIKKQPAKISALYENVMNACNNNDPEDAKYTLINWGNIYFNAKIISLGDLSHRIENHLHEKHLVQTHPNPKRSDQYSELIMAIDNLQHILYRDPKLQWQGNVLAAAIVKLREKPAKKADRPSALVDLYPVN